MDRIKTIVVATDFSDVATKALTTAAALATVHGARVVAVHVCELRPEFGLAAEDACETEDRIAAAAEVELKKAVEHCLYSRGIESEVVIRRGAPWEKIHNLATDVGADLIVIGARGQRGMPRVFGSVAERVVRTATRPVLVVQGGTEARAV
jgi:nucleotide-binding universal stress UspA family protein